MAYCADWYVFFCRIIDIFAFHYSLDLGVAEPHSCRGEGVCYTRVDGLLVTCQVKVILVS